MTSSAVIRVLLGSAMLIPLSACFLTKQPPYPVNMHDSTPVDQRADNNAYAGINDQTPIVAYEYGRCETDADCVPRGCNHAVCAPAEGLQAACITGPVGACLGELPTSMCGCTDEGVCRWTRNNVVLECASTVIERIQTRDYYGADGHTYPWRPYN